MRVNEQRNLVFPVISEKITTRINEQDVTEDVVKMWAYHTPISKEIFDAHFRVLSSTKATLSGRGSHYLMTTAPRIAVLTLRDEGKRDAAQRGAFDKQGQPHDEETPALIAEIKRLTMVLVPGQNGWEMSPVDAAISSGKLDEEDWEEVLSSITFFTCHYAMARKADRETTARAYASLIDASITSSSLSEFIASLLSSTQAESTKKQPSSIPS